jgi:SAM-dependent MidA family methyltransferase
MHSMSDLLYIADEFFDSLRKKILKRRKKKWIVEVFWLLCMTNKRR